MAKKTQFGIFGCALPWFLLALIVILLDQFTKIVVLRWLHEGQVVPVVSNFNLILTFNYGAAFSFLANASGWQHYFFVILAIVVSVFLIYLLIKNAHQKLFSFALACVLGGAMGNLIDRLWHGKVVDFLDFYVGRWHWPAFNLADSAICLGAFLLLIDELRRVSKSK